MKKVLKSVLIMSALVCLSMSLLSASYPTRAAPRDSDKKSGAFSRPAYVNNCARCHGSDGRGDTELGRLNDVPDLSGGRARRIGSAGVTRIITRGKGSMPGFGKKLNKKQIANLVAYVRGL